jgi:uncharacterized circularly permuted ATP-grasp superfamily protein
MRRLFPVISGAHGIEPVHDYPERLLRALQAAAPRGARDDPRVAVLTPGIYNSAYFEHAFLAGEMNVELVEGRDLSVDDGVVRMRTTTGADRVDVLYRRLDDAFLDPVGFHSDSNIGVPGLLTAMRQGTVAVVNSIGNGVADDKGIYPFVPDLIRYYLGEEPILPNVTTYFPWEPDQLRYVLDRLDRLVVKPVAGAGGHGLLIGPEASDLELAEFARAIEADPRGFIAQEVVQLSRHPTLVDVDEESTHAEGRHVDLRPFVLTSSDRVEVIPGGLSRVALVKGSLVVNSSRGGGSKDTWVLRPNEVSN